MCDAKDCDNDGLYSPQLTNVLWKRITNFYRADKFAQICLPCMEKALQRKLTRDDLADDRWNRDWVIRFPKAPRFKHFWRPGPIGFVCVNCGQHEPLATRTCPGKEEEVSHEVKSTGT